MDTEEHPSEITTQREYNARGYLAAVKENTTRKVLERYTAADAFGSVTAVTHGNGAKTARDFDANTGRMTGVETTHGGGASKTVAQDFGFEWRTDGTLEKRTKGSGTSELTETFTRDALRRLTRAKVSGAGGRQLDYDHDALGNLLHRNSSTEANVTLSEHDSTHTTAPGPHTPRFATVGTERRGIAWDAAGRMTSITVCATAGGDCAAKSGADHRHITWNARGEATRVLLGSSATDTTPTVREDFARGPDGALYFRKSAWRENGAERVERRYTVGRFEEVVPAYASSTNEWVRKTRITDTVLHVRVKPRGGTATSHYEYLHRDREETLALGPLGTCFGGCLAVGVYDSGDIVAVAARFPDHQRDSGTRVLCRRLPPIHGGGGAGDGAYHSRRTRPLVQVGHETIHVRETGFSLHECADARWEYASDVSPRHRYKVVSHVHEHGRATHHSR